MNPELIMHLGRRALETTMLLMAPTLGVMLAVGLLVAMLQAVTSVRDMTLGIVVKLGCLGLVLLVCGGWMMETAMNFTGEVFNHLISMGP